MILESYLDSKEIKPVNPKVNAEAEAPVLWPPDVKSWHIGKDPDACWEILKTKEEGAAEDEMVR